VGCFILVVTSLLGLATGLTGFLSVYAQFAFGVLLCGLLFLSAAGLFRNKKIALYSTIATAVLIIGLSGFSFVFNFVYGQINLVSSVTLTVWLLLGFFMFISILKTPSPNQLFSSTTQPKETDLYAVQTINATKKYVLGPNIVSAVKDINITIKKGEFVAIMGPSGSGKSTLLNLLGALDKPTSGQILIEGVDISTLSENELAKLRNEKLGFIFQAYNLIQRSTVARNIELPSLVTNCTKEKRQQKTAYLLDMVHLSNKANVKPKTLSGGEQQRIAICRALVNDPEILLSDEPTGNLDSKTGQEIMHFLRELNTEQKTTIIVVTHDPEVAKKTDRIIYFKDGSILKEERTSAGTFNE
jgi:putative ABC transport system ATP-binding protein